MTASAGLSVVIAGGHSAGHIEPAMNVADAIRRLEPSVRITALGTERGLDTTLIPARGYPLELIPPVPLPRRPGKALLQTPGKLRAAVAAAAAVLDRVGADVVVGFGGYVAVPAYLAARRRGIPIVVHEANARTGVANRLAARLTTHVFTASDSVRIRHGVAIGIPLRPAITELDRTAARPAARSKLKLDADRPTLLVTGGSQGAQRINGAALGAAPAFEAAGVQVLHIAGPKNPVLAPERTAGHAPYRVLPYLETMADAYAAADFVLCRSGAMTCAELTAVGLPAAYVPLPLRGGEQRLNAEPIVAAGGGLLVSDAECTPEWVADNVVGVLLDPSRLSAMTAAARGAGTRHAGETMARAVLEVARGHHS
ncbi:UDP-N-acetylglucosamine--N-acetylmuramyl-(pentapeptide) pyrophosphoryl-undecaprenol N-acetylglucosamine transferase [Jatrophihabitans telluris]|uniref:UDP-N-acetylglucosamine--N-acetylmuramyl-(pentapeptide) pyrophosphoryl-undecaprenol N-acetylglucosamine transferase n=1 Tax=Jatrophihabitans telluris TaxID=2038343 RepID=A0ABY4QUT6_9ACTN|nr:UDP-N-acetylglucosamine--N-acetylmuramyl-(pentapeptide) pyrophosphoryl-undecaprenol N-acetylglucosamine transferase [Jatrophihabitans telluris]UQX87188.1 UDP-N-acetylglucosamine--N-acetylmuramyl-(pentapeptide) pyrophosphoryl-undecaprenol N-acetylglucosamine transferase [Jatrophihabitans telluris]